MSLGLVGLAARPSTASASGPASPSEGALEVLHSMGLLSVTLALAVLALIVYAFAPRKIKGKRGEPELTWLKKSPPKPWWVRLLLTAVPILIVVGAIGLVLLWRGGGVPIPAGVSPRSSAPGIIPPAGATSPAVDDRLSFGLAGGIALVALFAFRFLTCKRGRSSEGTAGDRITVLSVAIEEGLNALDTEPDARRAVIAAYAVMERSLESHGLPRRPSEAPLEYVARVLEELHGSRTQIHRLTSLFELAKFSLHPIDQAMKGVAIEALVAVREELRAA